MTPEFWLNLKAMRDLDRARSTLSVSGAGREQAPGCRRASGA